MSAPKFLATGRCLPAKVVTNDDLSRTVDTNDEWVFSRTGIHARHFCQEESGMDLAEGAARQALEDVGDERAVYLPFMPPISEEAGEVGACGHPNLKAHRRFADILIRQVAELTGWQ